MTALTNEIRSRLAEKADETYRLFQAKLTPGVPAERMIGVRIPQLRALAKEYAKRSDVWDFLNDLPHETYDENNLHGLILSLLSDYDTVVRGLDAFLPEVDNWATCDIISPKVFAKNRARLRSDIGRWMGSDHLYTVRFGIEMLMSFFLDNEFDPADLDRVVILRSEEYYLNMMIAWYFATALAKQWNAALPILTEHRLAPWTHNKTIQKAIESYRITDAQKDLLRKLKL